MKQLQSSFKVDFLIVGVQKGGTTILDSYLRQHPNICMGKRKEIHFFDNEARFAADIIDYDYYHALFDRQPEHLLVGESTPIYSYWKPSPKRIWQYNKKIKLILLLRNPVERAYSHWNKETLNYQESKGGVVEQLSFYDALINEKERCKTALPLQHRIYSYIDRGFYTQQIDRLLHYFPEQQILILKSEALKYHTEATLAKIYSFLEITIPKFSRINAKKPSKDMPRSINIISPTSFPDRNRANIGHYANELGDKEKQYLIKIYTDEIRQLEKRLGWDCGHWLE
jgi:hypothetical protein